MDSVEKLRLFDQKLSTAFTAPAFLNKTYLPSLDGWRAVAITLVVLGHAKLTISATSYFYKFAELFVYAELGVRFFFVLSGFLITTLLIKEFIKYQKVNVKKFFIKRVLRIFPVLYLYLISIFLLNQIFNLGLNADHFLGPILYVNNFNLFEGTWLTGHTWSLAVEEQYYLIWPFIFSYLIKKLWLFCLIMICAVPLLKILWYFYPNYHTMTLGPFIDNADAIFSGSLLAILSFKLFFNEKQKFWSTKWLGGLCALVLFIANYCVHRGYFGLLFYPFSGTICNIIICILILKSLIKPFNGFSIILNNHVVVKLGIISYSLYIWQQLFLVPLNGYQGKLNFCVFPLNIVFAIVAAVISYFFFERHFLKLKRYIPE